MLNNRYFTVLRCLIFRKSYLDVRQTVVQVSADKMWLVEDTFVYLSEIVAQKFVLGAPCGNFWSVHALVLM